MEKFYYISFVTLNGFKSAISVRQPPTPGEETTLNIASAHDYISKLIEMPVVVLFFHEITEKRHEEFKAYCTKTAKDYLSKTAPKKGLYLVKDTNEEDSIN